VVKYIPTTLDIPLKQFDLYEADMWNSPFGIHSKKNKRKKTKKTKIKKCFGGNNNDRINK